MKKINEIIKSKPVQYIIVACAGLLVGWLLFSPSESPAPATHEGHEMHEGHSHDLVQDETGVWTCSMHPQIRQDKPGKCPICAMDLIPVRKGSGGGENSDPKAIQLSEEAPWQTCRLQRSAGKTQSRQSACTARSPRTNKAYSHRQRT